MMRQTGLSSQSFPYSSIFANRSSTIGLMNSISCCIMEGRFDIVRETILEWGFIDKETRIEGGLHTT